jgi:hypothetical protein
MQTISTSGRVVLLPVLLAGVLLVGRGALAQSKPVAQHEPGAPDSLETKVADPDALLAKAGQLYYSYARTGSGLDGFDCAVHPDWSKIVLIANKGVPSAADSEHVRLLNRVKLSLHARLKDESQLDWEEPTTPGKPLDPDSVTLLTKMHQATEQTVQGFLRFWAPFINGSAVPDSSHGIEITQTAKGYKLAAAQGGTSVTERFDSQLVLEEFRVAINGMAADFAPSYKPSAKGLLISGFTANIQPPASTGEPSQQMHVAIAYQPIDGFPIPATLTMDVVNTGKLDFVFDGCKVNQTPR